MATPVELLFFAAGDSMAQLKPNGWIRAVRLNPRHFFCMRYSVSAFFPSVRTVGDSEQKTASAILHASRRGRKGEKSSRDRNTRHERTNCSGERGKEPALRPRMEVTTGGREKTRAKIVNGMEKETAKKKKERSSWRP